MSEDSVHYAEKAKRAGWLLQKMSTPICSAPDRLKYLGELKSLLAHVHIDTDPDGNILVWYKEGGTGPTSLMRHAFRTYQVSLAGVARVTKDRGAFAGGEMTCPDAIYKKLYPSAPRRSNTTWQAHLLADDD